MNTVRRLAAPLRLVRARLERRGGRAALVGLGVAAGAAMLAAVLAGSVAAEDRSLARATARIPALDRAVRAVWGGLPGGAGESFRSLDRDARRALTPLPGRPFATVVFRETTIGDALVDLAGIDGLRRWAFVRSGRLPRPCRPQRCEVFQVAGSGPVPNLPGFHVVIVGHGRLRSPPLGTFLSAASANSVLSSAVRYHRAALPPFLVAEGVAGLARARPLDDAYRSYAWVVPLAGGSTHPWTLDSFAAGVTHARSDLEASSPYWELTAPLDEIQEAGSTARASARRLLLIGGEAAALLLAFAILAAASLRRDVEAAWQRLTWYGARRWQLVLFGIAEATAVATLATLVGWAVGATAGAVAADRAGAAPGMVLRHSVLSGGGIALAAGLAAAAALVLLAALRLRPLELGRFTLTTVDVAALGAVAAIALALSRGAVSSEGDSGTLLLLLPALVAFVVAVAAARLLVPALRLLERGGRRRFVPLRLASLSLARNPGHAVIAVTFLIVSLGLALFAETYRATLRHGQAEQAAYRVPLDYVAREDLTKLVPVTAVPHPRGAVPILRLSGDVSRLSGSSGFTLLGVPARALPGIDGWRDDFSPLSLRGLGQRLAPARPTALRGLPLHGGLRLPVTLRGDPLVVHGAVETRRGTFLPLSLGTVSGRTLLRARVPDGARLVALSFALANTGLHGVPNAGQNVNPVARGILVAPGLKSWIGENGMRAVGGGRIRYAVTTEADARIRPRQPTDGVPVPVVATPRIAAAAAGGALLPLEITGQPLTARVVGTIRRFPTVDGDLVLADRGTLATALNAAVPGSAVTNELWIRSDRRPQLSGLAVTSRRIVLRDLEADPLARGSLAVLLGAAGTALGLALLGLLLGLVADVRDEGGELFDLEAQGAGPRTLERHLRLRTLLVGATALAGGVAAGAALSALVVRLVSLTAQATTPQPPLRLHVDWPVVVVAVAAYALIAAALAVVATRAAFRSRAAGRFREAGA